VDGRRRGGLEVEAGAGEGVTDSVIGCALAYQEREEGEERHCRRFPGGDVLSPTNEVFNPVECNRPEECFLRRKVPGDGAGADAGPACDLANRDRGTVRGEGCEGLPDVCTEGIRTVLSASAGNGPRRFIILSNYGVPDSRHRTAYVATSWLLERAVLHDKEKMEALVHASDTDWTVVRAPVLTNGPRTGRYRTGADLRLSFTAKVSRADLAEFMLAELRDNAYLRRAVALTS
jgi:hypothetical protein